MCLHNLATGLLEQGIDVEILTFYPDHNDSLISNENYINALKPPIERRYGYSLNFRNELLKYSQVDIIHSNGLWQYTTHSASIFSRRNNIPYLISTHGMLYTEALRSSKVLKKLAMSVFQNKDLRAANTIHATSKKEFEIIRSLGFFNPVAVIPNASNTTVNQINIPKKSKYKVGFIGRLDPIKKIETLLEAWAITAANKEDWELVIIGNGETNYRNRLVGVANDLGITNISFVGFLVNEEKESILQSLRFLVLPSKSENFGMVVPEALVHEIPVIASKGTPWEELNTHNAGWWIDIGVEPLAKILREALSLPEGERQIMGINGRKLVEQKYSIEAVSRQMISLYEWILGKGTKPDFVYT